MEARIWYMNGDATKPYGEGAKVIVHCCNNKGAWGSGFVLALSKRWAAPKEHYLACDKELGTVGVVRVEDDIAVANLIGQEGIAAQGRLPPIRYEAIRQGFLRIVKWVNGDNFLRSQGHQKITIHMPRIGCWLAGGDWALIEPLINATFVRAGLEVTVYDFNDGPYFDSNDPESEPFLRQGNASV